MDVYPVPVFRVFFKKLLSGQKRVAISGRAFRVDEHQEQIGISCLGLLEIDLLKLEGVYLGGFGNFIALGHPCIELRVIHIYPGGIGLVSQGHLEGNHADAIF